MFWIPVLAVPLAAAFAKLGSTVTMVAVLQLALQVSGVVIALSIAALIWSLYRRPSLR